MGRRPDEDTHRTGEADTGRQTVVFYSFGDALYGGGYYDTQRIEDASNRMPVGA